MRAVTDAAPQEGAEPALGSRFDAEQDWFFRCLDLDAAGREALLATAAPGVAARVRRLLALDAGVEQGRIADPALAAVAPPERIGPYRLLERLGEGGMGTVWLARQDVPVRRLVAVKLLRPGLETPELLARFQAERQALAVMAHPGIARLLDAGEYRPGRPYLVMDYIDGLPLVEWCRRRGLGLRARLALFARLCSAVAHAHEKGVIHRDLKPGNVLVVEADGQPQPVVIDFGVAKALSAAARTDGEQTRIGSFLGTPDYMAPEQAAGDPQRIDTRSDVWALGAILFELLCDDTPFRLAARRLGIDGTLRVLREEDAPRPSDRVRREAARLADHAQRMVGSGPAALARALRGELDWIVQRALHRERARRYPSASALGADVQRVLDDAPVEARPPSFTYLAGKLARRNAAASVAALLVAASLAAGAVLVGLHARDLEAERDRTLAEATRANEVTAFLVGLFESADPRRGGSEDTTVLQLIERAEREVVAQPPDDARTHATVLHTLGDLYGSVGRYADAEPLFAAEVGLRARTGDAAGLARARSALATAWMRLGRSEEARALLETAVADLRRIPLVDAETFALVATGLVEARRDAGDPSAIDLVDDILRRLREQGREGGLRHACTLVQRGRLLRGEGRLPAAERALAEALAVLRAQAGDAHECTGGARSTLTLLLQDLGRHREAEAVAREQHAAYVRRLGPDHPETLMSLNNLALQQQSLGRPAQAAEGFAAAASGLAARFGDRHPTALHAEMNLQSARIDAGEARDAAARLAALQAQAGGLPASHLLHGALRMHRARALLQSGEPSAAATLAAEAVAHFERHPPPGALTPIRARDVLALALRATGDPGAARLHEALLDDARRQLGDSHPELQRLVAGWGGTTSRAAH